MVEVRTFEAVKTVVTFALAAVVLIAAAPVAAVYGIFKKISK